MFSLITEVILCLGLPTMGYPQSAETARSHSHADQTDAFTTAGLSAKHELGDGNCDSFVRSCVGTSVCFFNDSPWPLFARTTQPFY